MEVLKRKKKKTAGENCCTGKSEGDSCMQIFNIDIYQSGKIRPQQHDNLKFKIIKIWESDYLQTNLS